MAKIVKKKDPKKNNKAAAAPAVQTKPRELTRAEKTAAAREAAGRRNASAVNPVPISKPKQPAKPKQPSAASRPSARRTLAAKPTKQQQRVNSSKAINSKTNAQTPAHRHEARSGKKVSGSVKNIEIKHHTNTKSHSFRVKKKKQAVGRLLLSRLILFFVVFLLMFGMVAGLFSLNLKAGKDSVSKEYTLKLGQDISSEDQKTASNDEKPVYVNIPRSCSVRYGNLYIPVSALSDMCELTVTGTPSDLRYLPRSNEGHSMRFIVDSDIAYVNGAKVRMISPSFIHEGKLYIPLDFLQKYSGGLSISVDEGNRLITVAKLLEGYDASSDTNIYSNLSFNLSATSPLEAIEEPNE